MAFANDDDPVAGLVQQLQELSTSPRPIPPPTQPQSLSFKPKTDRVPDEISHGLDDVPRFLFRVSTPKSDGHTDAKWAKSRRVVFEEKPRNAHRTKLSKRDFLEASLEGAATDLNCKLRWWKLDNDSPACNLVSWTSSLLFALKYISYRHHHEGDRSPLCDINLMILDTARFSRGTFLRDLYLIDSYCDSETEVSLDRHSTLKDLGNLRYLRNHTDYYFGEYLSQGALEVDGHCSIVSAAQMNYDSGETLIPTKPTDKWANAVLEHRRVAYGAPQILREPDFRSVVRVASLFGENFRLPMAAALLGLKHHASPVEDTLAGILTSSLCLTEKEKMADYGSYPGSKRLRRKIQSREDILLEVAEFNRILRDASIRLQDISQQGKTHPHPHHMFTNKTTVPIVVGSVIATTGGIGIPAGQSNNGDKDASVTSGLSITKTSIISKVKVPTTHRVDE